MTSKPGVLGSTRIAGQAFKSLDHVLQGRDVKVSLIAIGQTMRLDAPLLHMIPEFAAKMIIIMIIIIITVRRRKKPWSKPQLQVDKLYITISYLHNLMLSFTVVEKDFFFSFFLILDP